MVLSAFLHKTSSKLKRLNFENKTSSIIKMSKSELINSTAEDGNNGIEEKESLEETWPGKESSSSEEEILSGVLVVNTNQRLLCRKHLLLR